MGFFATLNIILVTILVIYGLYKLFFFIKRKNSAEWIDQAKLQEDMRTLQIIDVREKDDYNKGHILGARSVPYTISRQQKEYLLSIRKDKPIYLYDNKNTLAIYMASLLKKEGYKDVYILKNGYSKWNGKTNKK